MPTQIDVERNGRRLGGLDWGGRGPTLLFLHPNGFCAGLFEPIARRLVDRFRCVGLDLAGHGASDPPEDLTTFGFADLADDVLFVVDELGIDSASVVGQSLGGGVSVLCERARPGLFTALLLCEPIVFPDPDGPDGHLVPLPEDRPSLAAITRKRRAVWPDRAAMAERYGSQPPLDDLDAESLEAYLRYGVVDRADGQVELACPPEVEATLFEISRSERGGTPAWEALPTLGDRAVILSGDRTNLPHRLFDAQAERAGCLSVVVSGGHFLLQEDSERGADLVARHLGGRHVVG